MKTMKFPWLFPHLLPFLGAVALAMDAAPPRDMCLVNGGSYKPLYTPKAEARTVQPFFMDEAQVTNEQFLQFVKAHPEWRRSQVDPSLADANYLKHWAGDLDLGASAHTMAKAPVTWVSWHAAKAYCEANGRRLPLQDEWEYAARADERRADASGDPTFLRQILDWYVRPANGVLPPVRNGTANFHGLHGMHGAVWEWVNDFNSTMVLGDGRGNGSLDRNAFCGAGAALSADPANYAAYMRFAFRSSLKADYCIGTLGFRAARGVSPSASAGGASAITAYDVPGRWLSAEGGTVTLGTLRGQICLVTMGFTQCQFACPRTLGDMQRIEQTLGIDANRIRFVFLSIDPQHDTPGQMKRALEERGLDARRWTFLSAADDIVRAAAVRLDFKYQFAEGFFSHSNLIAVLDEQGRIVHREEALGIDPGATVAAIRKLLARPKR